MLIYTVIIGVLISFFGFHLASFFDVSVAGSMAVTTGIIFAISFLYKTFNERIKKDTLHACSTETILNEGNI